MEKEKCMSVIIPIYNSETTVLACLQSVLNQTLSMIEVICIDDGSIDNSATIIKDLRTNDSRIKYYYQNNLGAGDARNAGIKAAKGEYIAFLDADDYYPTHDTLQKMYDAAVSHKMYICGGSFCTINGATANTEFTGDFTGFSFDHEGIVEYRDYQFDYGFYRFIYKRQFLIDNGLSFPSFRRYQDPPFMARAFSCAKEFYALSDVTYCYNAHQKGVNWNVNKVVDLLCGIENNIVFATEHSYEHLKRININRINNDFNDIIVAIGSLDDSMRIINKLLELSVSIFGTVDLSIANCNDNEHCLKPLQSIIRGLILQNKKLKADGWFINNKTFKAATFLLRKAGLYYKKHIEK